MVVAGSFNCTHLCFLVLSELFPEETPSLPLHLEKTKNQLVEVCLHNHRLGVNVCTGVRHHSKHLVEVQNHMERHIEHCHPRILQHLTIRPVVRHLGK